ncbi:acyltransferase family protein [Janthinobacterium sp. 17J80-10]|uniref:acyltransferase family protein n=1 Tax=Janthinobacterium sp. 17J80-10 TaxID=2497863 RepID=UPI00100560D2|nr:acyltransferase family protein [Janthinobacterium sp. 17J80-10]QAU33082.1 acyltransferase [Janthinobacterium sp. 17J80-10]
MPVAQINNDNQVASNINPDSALTHPAYRPDIDGLRAIAVLSVVGFHAFPKIFTGGFIGVDIFFVISGFLISTIIFGSLNRNSFSFVDFYSRRIKRIFPALLLLLTVSLGVGWFVLLPDEYAQLGKHAAAGSGFVSNFVLLAESGYFDNAAELKPLLHLWSLGIEEQFYIVWPLILWWAWKKQFNLLKIAVVVALLSFALNIGSISGNAIKAFYSPLTRFWELLAGSVLAYMALVGNSADASIRRKFLYFLPGYLKPDPVVQTCIQKPHNVRALLGAGLVLAGFIFINKERAFPGWWALLPVAGSVMLISAGERSWINRVILSRRPLVWVGLISFPLYLWHWPLLSFARIVEGETPSRPIRVAAVVIAIVLGWLTYRFVEKPLRFGKGGQYKTFALLILMALVGIAGYGLHRQAGMPSRAFAPQLDAYLKSIAVPEKSAECFEIPFAFEKRDNWFCRLGAKGAAPKIFAYGDSHALSLVPALDKLGTEANIQIQFTGNSGCPPLLGIQSMRGAEWAKKYNCQKLNSRIFEHVKNSRIDTVLLVARWTYYTGSVTRPNEFNPVSMNESEESTVVFSKASFEHGLQETIAKYRSIGVKVFLVEDNPQQIYDPKDSLKKYRRPSDTLINRLSVSKTEHVNNQQSVSKLLKSFEGEMVKTINFDDLLCTDEICPLVKDGQFLYSDDDHLSVTGALHIYPKLRQALSSE